MFSHTERQQQACKTTQRSQLESQKGACNQLKPSLYTSMGLLIFCLSLFFLLRGEKSPLHICICYVHVEKTKSEKCELWLIRTLLAGFWINLKQKNCVFCNISPRGVSWHVSFYILLRSGFRTFLASDFKRPTWGTGQVFDVQNVFCLKGTIIMFSKNISENDGCCSIKKNICLV